MRKLIAAINMTLDGFCDHTSGIPDEEIHDHYTNLLNNSGALIYGRITYQLMESFWPSLVKNPSGDKAMDDFAVSIENIHKIVFSKTMTQVDWKNVTLLSGGLEEKVLELKQQSGKDIFVGSPGLIVSLLNLNLIDEYQLCVHPVIVGSGLPLFKTINDKKIFKLVNTKIFGSGAIILYYRP